MSLPIGSVVTDVTLESLSAANQSNTPITFGQVFKVGDTLQGESLVGRIGKDTVPLQYEVKATHADGSVRHAIISLVLPSLSAKTLPVMQLVKSAPSDSTSAPSTPTTASVTATIAGVKYSATVDNTHLANKVWLSGNIVQEKQFNVPFTTADGTAHPHLYARFALRDYTAIGNVRVDVAVENNWAYESGPQNFVYDLENQVNGNVVYSQAALNHYHHARHRKVYWTGSSPQVNVRPNLVYFLAAKAVPYYDPATPPSEKTLQQTGALALNAGPMQIGATTAYMPMTGGRGDIGILPDWQVNWLLSGDSRARDTSLVTANGAGSFPMHYRDKNTDRPVSLKDHPRMTMGNVSDAGTDAFPWVDTGNDANPKNRTPLTPEIPHHPALPYLPYLLTGDYYYLEELQFWAMWCVFSSNPGYRGAGLGLVIPEQLRGQAWALRTLTQATYITPDDDSYKQEFTRILNNNFDWYNSAYTNNKVRNDVSPGDSDFDQSKMGNDLGTIVNGFAVAYDGNTGVAPWMDDFFTSVIGYAADLGFTEALHLLAWKAQFPVGRMTADGVCWVTAVPYNLHIRETGNGPFYKTLKECYTKQLGEKFMALPCASPEMAQAWNATGYPSNQYPSSGGVFAGDMSNIAFGNVGYPSNMQPALAYCAEYDLPNARKAWDLFMSRSVQCDYSNGAQFNVVPRNYKAQPVAPYVDTDTRVWNQIGKEGETVNVPDNTTVRYGANGLYSSEEVMSGEIVISNATFGGDPAPNTPKFLQQLIPSATPPIKDDPIMTFKVSVALTFANQTLPAGSEASAAQTLVELLAADGVTVVASSATVYEFSGINAGDYVVRASGIDSKGAVMGVPYTQAFTIVEEVVTPPVDTPPVEPAPQPVDVSLPSGITVSYVKE
jgi:hypothetical protein